MVLNFIWLSRNRSIYETLSLHQRINLKNDSGVSLVTLMFQHPDILRNRIRRFVLP